MAISRDRTRARNLFIGGSSFLEKEKYVETEPQSEKP
jgi:hypothetical protein